MALALELYPTEKARFDKREGARIRLFGMTQVDSRQIEVFRRFLTGDDGAFTEVYGQHNQRLFNYCAKILRDHLAAGDIAHTVWERIIERRGELQDLTNPLGFCYRTARNLCLDHLKHERFRSSLDLAESLAAPSGNNLSHEEELAFQALDTLPEETKEIFILHYYSGYSFEEIAEILGKRSNAIYTKVSRARKQLKETIEKELAKERNIQ